MLQKYLVLQPPRYQQESNLCTAWAEPILSVSGETASISFYTTTACSSYLREVFSSPKNAICRTPVLDQVLTAAERQRLSLTGSSVPRQGDDSSIHVTSFSTALAIAVLSPPVTSLSALAPAQRAGGVLGMLSSLEVKVLYPT